MKLAETIPACISLKYHIGIGHGNIQIEIPSRGQTQLRSSAWCIEIVLVPVNIKTI